MIRSCVTGRERNSENIAISILQLKTFLLFAVWLAGCGTNLQVPISDTGSPLDIADFNTVLEIVDVSEPTKPVRMSSISLPSKPEYYSSISLWKQFVLATTAYGVHFLDAANPAAPKLLWNLPLETLSGKTVIYDDYAFFPTRNGLYVLHLKNALEPQWIFHAGKKEFFRSHLIDLEIRGSHAYAHDAHKYLHVFNLSQPEQPKLVNSYAVNTYAMDYPRSLLLFRALGEEAELIQQTFNVYPYLETIDARLRPDQLKLPSDFSSQLADWNNLLELGGSPEVKAQMSPQLLCWLFRDDNDARLWYLPSERDRIYLIDVVPEYIRCQYNSGVKRRPKAGHVTDAIRDEWSGEIYLISQDNWIERVKFDPDEGGRITDFQLSANLVYILMEHGGLFIAELYPASNTLRGLALLENVSQSSQCLTVDKNLLYILSVKGRCSSNQPELEPQQQPPSRTDKRK